MFERLAGITVTCFAASYLVTLGLEASRLWFRVSVRWALMVGFMVAGLLAHTLFLWNLGRGELGTGVLFSSWHDWSLLAAWVIALAYLGLALRRPRNTVGIFILPLVLAFVGLGVWLRGSAAAPKAEALGTWGVVHGICLLLGSVSIALGFATGLMYLAHAWRLKRKLPPQRGLRLPSLEWLQRFTRESLFLSTGLLLLGLASGVILKLNRQSQAVGWTDPLVIWSAVLGAWLVAMTAFESLYRPARDGHKVVYLSLASAVLLAVSLLIVVVFGHGETGP